MQAALAAVAAFLLLLPGASAQALDLTFDPPGQASPAVDAGHVDWVLILFRGGRSQVAMDWPQGGHAWNLTHERARADYLDGKVMEGPDMDSEASRDYGPLAETLAFSSDDWGSLYLEGDGIHIHAGSALADLKPRPDGQCARDMMLEREFNMQPARSSGLCPRGDHAVASLRPLAQDGSMAFTLDADRVHAAEWHNAHTNCEHGAPCPPGGRRVEELHPVGALNASAGTEYRTYERLSNDSSPASVGGAGEAVLILAGSSNLDLRVDGWLRLPGAEIPKSCASCVAPDGKTLQATGNVTLAGLRMTSPSSLSGSLGGSIDGVRFDEASVDPRLVLGLGVGTAAVALTVGVLALAKGLLAFTRVQPDRAVAHPRRRAIKDYVDAHPGAGFREVMRATGLSPGSVRHHVEILKQTGHITEQRHGQSRRFLPVGPGLKTEQQRMGAILLREPALDRLMRLVRENPWRSQKQFTILAAERFGWSASTTQHRLGRLVKGGLVEVKKSGRQRLHATRAGVDPGEGAYAGDGTSERRREPRSVPAEAAPAAG